MMIYVLPTTLPRCPANLHGFDTQLCLGRPGVLLPAVALLFAVLLPLAGTAYAQTWTRFTAADGGDGERYGESVAISGDRMIVGDSADDEKTLDAGAAYFYLFHEGAWWVKKITASHGQGGGIFGMSVAISDDYILVGAPGENVVGEDRPVKERLSGLDAGAAYFFDLEGDAERPQKIVADDFSTGEFFGWSVSISDTWAMVSCPRDSDKGFGSGSVYVFQFDGSTWVKAQKLTASDGASGDHFGSSVYLHGDLAIIGARDDDDKGFSSGAVYVFQFDGTAWIEQQKLVASDAEAGDEFGASVAINGDRAIVGAPNHDEGAAYIFRHDGTTWVQQKELSARYGGFRDKTADKFGTSVAIGGDRAVVGAVRDYGTGPRAGLAFTYRFEEGTWVEEQKLRMNDNQRHEGGAVAMDGNRVVVGATGHIRAQKDADVPNPGEVFVYELDGQGQWTRDMFEMLFPEPSPGWLISDMQVQELKTFAQISGIEGMTNMASGISGTGTPAPSVRYQLSRAYRDSRDSTHTLGMIIDSENIEVASLVLTAHGYSRIEDGEPVPLSDDKKTLQDQVLSTGARPFGHANHLGLYAMQDAKALIWMLVDEIGVMTVVCEYVNCFDDLDALVKHTDLQRLDAFARFDHRKQRTDE